MIYLDNDNWLIRVLKSSCNFSHGYYSGNEDCDKDFPKKNKKCVQVTIQ